MLVVLMDSLAGGWLSGRKAGGLVSVGVSFVQRSAFAF